MNIGIEKYLHFEEGFEKDQTNVMQIRREFLSFRYNKLYSFISIFQFSALRLHRTSISSQEVTVLTLTTSPSKQVSGETVEPQRT